MLTKVIEYAVFRMRSPAVIRLLHLLVKQRNKRATAKKCRVEDSNLVIGTDRKDVSFSTSGLLAQLGRIDDADVIPALADLISVYDSSGLLLGRSLWKMLCVKKSPVVLFRYGRKDACFSAVSSVPVRFLPGTKLVSSVVKLKTGTTRCKLQPSRTLQMAMLDVLRRMADDGQEG